MATVIATIGPLEIVTFTNRGKARSVSYRVSGTIQGRRIRKNFPTEAEARSDAHARTRGLLTTNTAPRTVFTTLTDDQVRAGEAFYREAQPGIDPLIVLRFYREHHRPITPLSMRSAVDAFADWLTSQRKNDKRTVDKRVYIIDQFASQQKVQNSDAITVADAQAWIYSDTVAVRTQRDRYDLLKHFASFLVKKRHATTNPVLELDRPVVRINAPGVLTFRQIWDLLMCALTDSEGPQMLPFFAIAVLSGVRPQEIPRLGSKRPDGTRDGWDDIYLEIDHRIIEVNKAKGGRSRRNAEICDPLWRILTWCKERKLAPNFFSKKKFDRIRRAAGLFDTWEQDLLRHSYASHHYVLHKDIKTLTANMGNSERVLFQNYIRPVPHADAIALFGIILHWQTSRKPSLMGLRIDRLLLKPPSEISTENLRILHMQLAGEHAKLTRNHASPEEVEAIDRQLTPVLQEVWRRENRYQPATGAAPLLGCVPISEAIKHMTSKSKMRKFLASLVPG